MIVFVNCNNLDVFSKFIETYSDNVKKYKYIIGRQDIGICNKKDWKNCTNNDVAEVLIKNGITNFEFILASNIDSTIQEEIKTDLYKITTNMLMQIWAPLYIHKLYPEESILTLEEDLVFRCTDNFLNSLTKSKASFSSLTLRNVLFTNKGNAWLSVQNISNTDINQVQYIAERKIWGCPKFYMPEDLNKLTQYYRDVFTSKQIANEYCKLKVWHHGYFDEMIFSFSPVQFERFDTDIVLRTMPGNRGINSFKPDSIVKRWDNCIVHIAGLLKLETLKIIMEAVNGKIQ